MVRWIARIVLAVFFNTIAVVDIIGMENIPSQGSYVAVSNHLGRLDPALVYYILPRKDVYLMVAEKYQKYAFVRWLVKHLNGMFIDRYNADFPPCGSCWSDCRQVVWWHWRRRARAAAAWR